MQRESHQWFTERLGRAMGLRVYGHWGMPLLAFPTSGGDEWEMEGQGMVAALEEFIDGGRIKLFCVGSNGDQSFYDKGAHPFHRSWMQRQWDEYIRREVIPFIHSHCNGLPAIATMGASLGAYHAANTLFKHPDAVRVCFAMSGLYDLRTLHGRALRRQLLLQQPHRLHRRHDRSVADRPDLERARAHLNRHGPFEHPSHSYDLSRALSFKGISHHLDDWGPLGGHDWPYWKHQMREYLKGI